MNKYLLLFLFCAFCACSAFAQKTYFVVGLGYGLPSSQQSLFRRQNPQYPGFNGPNANQSIHGSYGAGLSLNTGFRHLTKNNWGWGIEMSYLLGRKIGSDIKTNFGDGFSQVTLTSKSNAFFITPFVFKNFVTEGKVQPYVVAGLIVGAPKVVTDYTSLTDYDNSSTPDNKSHTTDETTHQVRVGTKLAGGIDIKTGKKSAFFIELEVNILSPWQKELKSSNGTTIAFEKEFDLATAQGNNQIADTTPFGSWGIRVGYRLPLEFK